MPAKQQPLINQQFLLQRMPGKGGWTFVDLPDINRSRQTPFGWLKVRGTIDGFAISKYHLMPYKGGKLFLPVKKEIRKKILKDAGDHVHIVLYLDNEPTAIPDELLLCLQDEPAAYDFFISLNENEKMHFIKWIYAVKTEEAKAERILAALNQLAQHQKFNSRLLH